MSDAETELYCPQGHRNPGHPDFCAQCGARIYGTPELIQWAHCYDAYKRLARDAAQLAELLRPLRETLTASGQIPDWVGVDLLRGWAFFLARADHHQWADGSTLGTEFVAVVDAIDRHPAAYPRERSPLNRSVTPADTCCRAGRPPGSWTASAGSHQWNSRPLTTG